MKTNKDITNRKHAFGLALGVVAAIVVLFSQSFYYDYVSSVEVTPKTEQTDAAETIIKMAHQALSSVAEFAVQSLLHFISEIHIVEEVKSIDFIDHFTGFIPYFETLFRLIISPNAP